MPCLAGDLCFKDDHGFEAILKRLEPVRQSADLHGQSLPQPFRYILSVIEIRGAGMVSLFHVAVLTGLVSAGWDIGMEVASVEGGALNRMFKFKSGSKTVALAAHGSLLHKGALFDPYVFFFWKFLFSLGTVHDLSFRKAVDDAFVLVADHAGNIEFFHSGSVII